MRKIKLLILIPALLSLLYCERYDMYKGSRGCVADGPEGYYMTFNGSTDYVSGSNDPKLSFTQDFTIEAWVKADVANTPIIGKYITAPLDPEYLIKFTGSLIQFDVKSNGTVSSVSSTSTISPGSWHHVSCVVYSGRAIIYIDGIQEGSISITYPLNNNSNPLLMFYDGTSYFSGAIDEVRIWNIARSEEDIKFYMNCTLTGREYGLVAYYKFNEGSGSAVYDSSKNGLNSYSFTGSWVKW